MEKNSPKCQKMNLLSKICAVFGLSQILGSFVSQPAEALQCLASSDLAASCESGIYDFDTSAKINVLFFNINFQAELLGNSRMIIGTPVDGIVDDLVLGNVGTLDGVFDVIPVEIFTNYVFTYNPLDPRLLLEAFTGDSTPDLAPTPPDTTLPLESLHTRGALIARGTNSSEFDSLFKVFLELHGTVVVIERNFNAFTLSNQSPFQGFVPGSSVPYASSEVVPLLYVGDDGVFWTGDERPVTSLIPNAEGNSIVVTFTQSVPEPGFNFAFLSLSILGLAGLLGKARLEKN